MATFNDTLRAGGTVKGPLVVKPRSASEVPLTVDGLSASGASDILLRVRNSAGTVLFSVDNTGNLSFAGSGTITIDQTVTGNLVVNGNTTLGNSIAQDTLTVNAAATFAGTTTFTGLATLNNLLDFGSNKTFTAGNYQIGRNGNAEQQYNVPLTSLHRFTVEDTQKLSISSTTVAINDNLVVAGTATINGSITVTGSNNTLGATKFSDGTVGAPSITFTNDSDTGFYRVSSGLIGFAINGYQGMSLGLDATFGTMLKLKDNTGTPLETHIGNFAAAAAFPRTYFLGGQDATDTNWAVRFAHKNSSSSAEIPVAMQISTNGDTSYTNADTLVLASYTTYAVISTFTGSASNGQPLYIGTNATDASNVIKIDTVANQQKVTFTNSIIGGVDGVSAQVTGSGTVASALSAVKASLLAGYTGTSGSFGLYAQNKSAGTTTNLFSNVQAAAYGEYIVATPFTTGHIVGVAGYADGGAINYGGFFRSIVSRAATTNIGVAGFGLDALGDVQIGGYFGLQNTNPTYTSAALIADNGAVAAPIFIARDNGTTIFTIADGGSLQPGTNDGTSIGVSGTAFSDLFLASGAVINFAASNYTITHATNYISTNGAIQITSNSSAPTAGIGMELQYDGTQVLFRGINRTSALSLPFHIAVKQFVLRTDDTSTVATIMSTDADGNGYMTFTAQAKVGGATAFTITPPAHTAVIAEVNDFKVGSHTMTITGGYIAQSFSLFGQPTISAASSLTVTTAVTQSIVPPTVASSAIITNTIALGIGDVSSTSTIANASGSTFSMIRTSPQTITLANTTQITSSSGASSSYLDQITVNQSGGAVTMDNAATLYIVGAPIAGTSVTITNPYALFVDAGTARFDGNFVQGATAVLSNTTASFVGNSASVQPLGIQNLNVSGYSFIDIFDSTTTKVAGFGYANASATPASTAYFYTVNKVFQISTDNGVTAHANWALTSGALTLATKATAGGATAATITQGAHTAVTAAVADLVLTAHTLTITGGYTTNAFNQINQATITAASGLTVTTAKALDIVPPTAAGSAIITNTVGINVGLFVTGSTIADGASNTYKAIMVSDHTVTLAGTPQMTATPAVSALNLQTITVAQSGGAVTVDNVATLYIEAAPAAGASVTLTNSYAVWVDAGTTRLDGNLIGSGTVVFDNTTTSSGAGAVAITGSIHEITTTGTGNALTLADGTEGQILRVVYVAEGAGADTAILTPTNLAGADTTITFNAIGDAVTLLFTASTWFVVGQKGVTIA